jgi:uncharacterized protein (UPF0297 family)
MRAEHVPTVVMHPYRGIVDDPFSQFVGELEAEDGVLAGPVPRVEPARAKIIAFAEDELVCRVVFTYTQRPGRYR